MILYPIKACEERALKVLKTFENLRKNVCEYGPRDRIKFLNTVPWTVFTSYLTISSLRFRKF